MTYYAALEALKTFAAEYPDDKPKFILTSDWPSGKTLFGLETIHYKGLASGVFFITSVKQAANSPCSTSGVWGDSRGSTTDGRVAQEPCGNCEATEASDSLGSSHSRHGEKQYRYPTGICEATIVDAGPAGLFRVITGGDKNLQPLEHLADQKYLQLVEDAIKCLR